MTHGNLRSMTGFGEAERATEAGRLRAEVRTVNHRFLNFQVRTPSGLDRLQPVIERTLRVSFTRGNVSLTLLLEREDAADADLPPAVVVDLARARAYIADNPRQARLRPGTWHHHVADWMNAWCPCPTPD